MVINNNFCKSKKIKKLLRKMSMNLSFYIFYYPDFNLIDNTRPSNFYYLIFFFIPYIYSMSVF